jgi:hypothetical protein
MSNIQFVDGVCVNFDLIKVIEIMEVVTIDEHYFILKFVFNYVYQNVFCHENQRVNDSRFEEIVYGKVKYETREQITERIERIRN